MRPAPGWRDGCWWGLRTAVAAHRKRGRHTVPALESRTQQVGRYIGGRDI